MISDTQSDCTVRFFYYVNGNSSKAKLNTFSVYAEYVYDKEKTDYLFTTNAYVSFWNKNSAKLRSQDPFRFVFSAILYDYHSSIGLDDISYSDGCILTDKIPKRIHSKLWLHLINLSL